MKERTLIKNISIVNEGKIIVTDLLIDNGLIQNVPAPSIAISYWGLPITATLRDVILAVRADEEEHRDVNHNISSKFLCE